MSELVKKKKIKIKHYINYIVVSAFLFLMMFFTFTGRLPRSSATLLTQIAYSIILAVSLNLVVGFLGELSLGHAGFMCVGAYLGCYISNCLHPIINNPAMVIIISMIVGGLVAAIFGFIIGLPALRLRGDYLAIVTLAFGEIVRNIFKNIQTFGGAQGLRTIKYQTETLYIIAFACVLIVLFLIQNLVRSKHGRAITAIRDNEIAAKAMGINVTFYKLSVFVIAAFFAGVAGVIYGHYTTPVLYSFFSYNYSIEILVMVVLGGMGNINGSIIAAALITFINYQLQANLSGELAALKYLIYAIILIVVVLFNNTPSLQAFREKYTLKNIIADFKNKKHDPSHEQDDEAKWGRVPTKIDVDEVVSTVVASPKKKDDTKEVE